MNIKIYRNFAVNTDSIQKCKILLENEFSIVFEEHESIYRGIYFKSTFLNSVLKLSENYYETEDYWIAPDFKMLNTVVSVEISKGKKRDRLSTDEVVFRRLSTLNFQLVSTYEKEEN